MNYQELSGIAAYQAWAQPLKQKIDAENETILATRQRFLDRRTKIGVGDFVLGGAISYSGSLGEPIQLDRLQPTEEKRTAPVWIFSENDVRAHNSVYLQADFRIFRLI